MSIKILHLIDHLGLGGAQMSVKNITENLDPAEFENIICALRPKEDAFNINAEVITLPFGKWDLRAIPAIIKLCKKKQINIIHSHLQKAIIFALTIRLFYNIPVIVHERGAIYRKGPIFSLYRILLRFLHFKASLIIANSKATAGELNKRAGIKTSKIKTIPNAVDFSKFQPDKYSKQDARNALNIPQNVFVIGFAGRLHKVKGIDILIDAFNLLMQKSNDCYLIIAGNGPLKKQLENKVVELNLKNNIKFLGVTKNISLFMAACDLGAVPSTQEPFGRVALEFMRMRIPVVSSGANGLAAIVLNEKTGFLIDENTPSGISSTICRVKEDENLKTKVVENAYNFTEIFSIDNYNKKLRNLYLALFKKVK